MATKLPTRGRSITQYPAAQRSGYPFGETRGTVTPVTDRQFTGQRAETGLGSLYDYGARLYSPALGRFLSADTIVPDPSNPQSLNRYSYVRNRPLNSIDPSGHVDCDKNQWGDTCESSTAHEKEQADAHNNLCAYNPAACEYNTQEVGAVLELLGSVLLEPVDWFLSGRECLNGDCSGVLLGMLPFVPGSARKLFNAVENGADVAKGTNKLIGIGSRTIAEIAGNTPIKPGIQGMVDNNFVEKYAKAMSEGTFDWDKMKEPMKFMRSSDGSLTIMEGHHRFLAAQMTGTPIPFDNPLAVEIIDYPGQVPSGNWNDYKWSGF